MTISCVEPSVTSSSASLRAHRVEPEVGSSRTSRSGCIDSTVASAARRASPPLSWIRVPVREAGGADRGQGIVHPLVAFPAPP